MNSTLHKQQGFFFDNLRASRFLKYGRRTRWLKQYTHLTCIWHVPTSNSDQHTAILRVLRSFLESLQTNEGMDVPKIWPQLPPSTAFTVRHTPPSITRRHPIRITDSVGK